MSYPPSEGRGVPPEARSEADHAAAAQAYARAKFRLGLVSGGLDLALLAAWLLSGASRAFAARLPYPPALQVLAYVVALGALFQLVEIPFAALGRRLEIRYQLNRQGLASWLWDEAKSTLLGAALGVGAAELVYWLLRAAPVHWWIYAWAVFTVFAVGMAQLAPVLLLPLFFKFRQLSTDDPNEAAVIHRLQARLDANPRLPRLHGIYEWKLGEKSAKANAALTGWGRTRRVILSDTLLASSPPEEIDAVFAHELGHHVHRHIWRGLAFQSGLSLLGFWLARQALAAFSLRLGLGGPADIAGLPLLLLVFAGLGLVLLPINNGFSRAMERQADDYAFRMLGSAQPLMAGLNRLARQNLAEVAPARWKEWLLYSHPSIGTRIKRGLAWEAKNYS